MLDQKALNQLNINPRTEMILAMACHSQVLDATRHDLAMVGRSFRSLSFSIIKGTASCSRGYLKSALRLNGRLRCSSREVEIIEGDVVAYRLPKKKGIGVVVDFTADPSKPVCHVEPLVKDPTSQDEWLLHEEADKILVPLNEVRAVQFWYSERMVPDRISNPHGEHAEGVWSIEENIS